MTTVAHAAIVTPGRCGLYETTRELVAAERAEGIDARIVDPRPDERFHVGSEDRGVPIADMAWAVTADLIVSHSGHDKTPLAETDQPILVAAHGRPISTFIMEREGGAPAYSYHAARSRQPRYKACITFWQEYLPYFRDFWGKKPVYTVPATVDLDHWCPGPTDYDFAGRKGEYNVVMTDPWSRRDVTLLPLVHAFNLFREESPGARLHIYALDGNDRGIGALKSFLGDSLGVVQGWATDLRRVYRAADMLITPHRIATRSIREATACGLQVVSGVNAHPEDIEEFADAMATRTIYPIDTRANAERRFSMKAAGEAMASIVAAHARQELAHA